MSELKKNTQMFFDFGSGEENTPEDASLNDDLLSVFEEETPEEIEVVELEDYEEEWADVPVVEAAEKEPQPLPRKPPLNLSPDLLPLCRKKKLPPPARRRKLWKSYSASLQRSRS